MVKAMAVEEATTGLITGAASMKVMALYSGTPFKTSLLAIGTIPHSHTGNIIPSRDAMNMLNILFLGNILLIVFSETKF